MAIRLADVSLKYGEKQIFDRFNLTLPEQGLVCFFGPSGCGKTSLLRLLAGLSVPDSGALSGLNSLKPSMVFQENRLLPWLTASENVSLVLPECDAVAAHGWLEQVELGAEADKLPRQLSGGMQRRIALARALAYGGDMLLLDEPFTGLDTALAERLLRLIARLYAGKLIVMITHDKHLSLMADHLYTVEGLPFTLSRARFP